MNNVVEFPNALPSRTMRKCGVCGASWFKLVTIGGLAPLQLVLECSNCESVMSHINIEEEDEDEE